MAGLETSRKRAESLLFLFSGTDKLERRNFPVPYVVAAIVPSFWFAFFGSDVG